MPVTFPVIVKPLYLPRYWALSPSRPSSLGKLTPRIWKLKLHAVMLSANALSKHIHFCLEVSKVALSRFFELLSYVFL